MAIGFPPSFSLLEQFAWRQILLLHFSCLIGEEIVSELFDLRVHNKQSNKFGFIVSNHCTASSEQAFERGFNKSITLFLC